MADKRITEPKDPKDLILGEVIGMLRKSSDGEKAGKSLDGQEGGVLEAGHDYGLPIDKEHIWREQAGMSGKLWWSGGGYTGIQGDDGPTKTRPVLSKIVNGIVAGSIRCVVVWSLDRIARHVGIMEALVEIMNKYGCLLYDRRGPVDIFSPEGRNNVRNGMTSAQYARERAAVDAPRGVDHNKIKGKIVISANRLGFRAVGKASGEIVHRPDEQDLAYELYHLYVLGTPANATYGLGEPGHGPYSVPDLGEMLTKRPDIPWLDGVYERRVNCNGNRIIHPGTLYNILADPIYQGRQRHRKVESSCPIFLKADGEPVIPIWLFEAAQVKLENGRQAPGVKKHSYSLSSLIRCGVCGTMMVANASGGIREDGTYGKVPAWVARSRKGNSTYCSHKIPSLPMRMVDRYVLDHLAPYLLAELQARNSAGENSALANEKATLNRHLIKAQSRLDEELPLYLGKVSPEMVGNMESKIRTEIVGYRLRLQAIERRLGVDSKFIDGLHALENLSNSAKRDILREVLRWVVVVPSGPICMRFRSPNGTQLAKQHKPAPLYPTDEGRMVFLTTWGSIHTAFIYKQRTDRSHMPIFFLRPAGPDEVMPSVNDLPDPKAFVRGIEQSYIGMRRPFCVEEVAPGLFSNGDEQVAVFEMGDDDKGI